MEAHVQSKHQDELLPSMRYDSEPTASYIDSCRVCRFFILQSVKDLALHNGLYGSIYRIIVG